MIHTQQWLGLSQTHLVECQGEHKLQAQVCKAFLQMQQAAAKDHIDMQIVSSFRGFDRQKMIWDTKWAGQRPLYSLAGDLLKAEELTDQQKLHAILIWSALPGASRHHWGTDLDVYDKRSVEKCDQPFKLVSEEYAEEGPCYRLNTWLDQHAEKFGFYRPYSHYTGGVAPEAWHISFKPMADAIVKQLSVKTLAETLKNTNVQGKATIMKNLDEIFSRYTLNGLQL